jgi:hypothetical protein
VLFVQVEREVGIGWWHLGADDHGPARSQIVDVKLLLCLILQERYQVVPVLILLETAECHLRAWNVFLGVLEVLKLDLLSECLTAEVRTCLMLTYQSLVAPYNIFRLVGLRVRKAFHRASVSTEQP